MPTLNPDECRLLPSGALARSRGASGSSPGTCRKAPDGAQGCEQNDRRELRVQMAPSPELATMDTSPDKAMIDATAIHIAQDSGASAIGMLRFIDELDASISTRSVRRVDSALRASMNGEGGCSGF